MFVFSEGGMHKQTKGSSAARAVERWVTQKKFAHPQEVLRPIETVLHKSKKQRKHRKYVKPHSNIDKRNGCKGI